MDTWGWLALANPEEDRHQEVRDLLRDLREREIPHHTSDYVLDELISWLFRHLNFEQATAHTEAILSSGGARGLRIHRVNTERFMEAWRLRKRYQDKPGISFTDLTSMVLIQEFDLPTVLTDDSDFLKVDLDVELLP